MSDSETPEDPAARVAALVDQWFFESFHGSLVARSTEVWNLVQAAKDDLQHRLAALLAAPPHA